MSEHADEIAAVIHDHAVVRGDLSEQYSRDQLRDKVLAIVAARVAEVEAKVARVEALAGPGFIPGPAILCASPQDRDDQWRKALRAALSDGSES